MIEDGFCGRHAMFFSQHVETGVIKLYTIFFFGGGIFLYQYKSMGILRDLPYKYNVMIPV